MSRGWGALLSVDAGGDGRLEAGEDLEVAGGGDGRVFGAVPQPAVEVGRGAHDLGGGWVTGVGVSGVDVGLVVVGAVAGVGAGEAAGGNEPGVAGVGGPEPQRPRASGREA